MLKGIKFRARAVLISALLFVLMPLVSYTYTTGSEAFFSSFPIPTKNSGLNETIFVRIGNARLLVEVADTPSKRSIGLMFREKLEEDRGMLFVFPEEDYLSFWMKNTKIPLSLGYFNKEGILLEIHNMKPNQIHTTYSSRSKAIYALEVNQGWFEKNSIKEGAVLILEKPLLGR